MSLPKKNKGKGTSTQLYKKVKGEPVIQYEHGEPLDPVRIKEFVPQNGMTVAGISKGITVNIGNYESARVDAWVIQSVPNDELNEAMAEMSAYVDVLVDEELTQLAKIARQRK